MAALLPDRDTIRVGRLEGRFIALVLEGLAPACRGKSVREPSHDPSAKLLEAAPELYWRIRPATGIVCAWRVRFMGNAGGDSAAAFQRERTFIVGAARRFTPNRRVL